MSIPSGRPAICPPRRRKVQFVKKFGNRSLLDVGIIHSYCKFIIGKNKLIMFLHVKLYNNCRFCFRIRPKVIVLYRTISKFRKVSFRLWKMASKFLISLFPLLGEILRKASYFCPSSTSLQLTKGSVRL